MPDITEAVVAAPTEERDHESSSEEKSRRSRQSLIAEERRRSPPKVPAKVETMLLTCWIWVIVEWSMERKPVEMVGAGEGKVGLKGGGWRWGLEKEDGGDKERHGESRRKIMIWANIQEAILACDGLMKRRGGLISR